MVPRSVCIEVRSVRKRDEKRSVRSSSTEFGRKGRLTLRVLARPEIILLSVGSSEDVVPDGLESNDSSDGGRGEFGRVESEVSSLEGVGEGDPSEISEGKHEAETVGGDVHLGEDGRLRNEGTSKERRRLDRTREVERRAEKREKERES